MASRINQYMEARNDGLAIALRVVREEGLEGLEREIGFRNATGISISKTNKELDQLTEPLKKLTFHTIRIASIAILHDEFGFGEKRVRRFDDAFDKLMAYLDRGWAYWIDIISEIHTRLNITVDIPDGENKFPDVYRRPKNEDIWEEKDLIGYEDWQAVLKELNYTEKKVIVGSRQYRDIYDDQGMPTWRYENRYDQISLYDFFTGIMYAKKHYRLEAEDNKTLQQPAAINRVKKKKRKKR